MPLAFAPWLEIEVMNIVCEPGRLPATTTATARQETSQATFCSTRTCGRVKGVIVSPSHCSGCCEIGETGDGAGRKRGIRAAQIRIQAFKARDKGSKGCSENRRSARAFGGRRRRRAVSTLPRTSPSSSYVGRRGDSGRPGFVPVHGTRGKRVGEDQKGAQGSGGVLPKHPRVTNYATKWCVERLGC
jgi:hypothetical protein